MNARIAAADRHLWIDLLRGIAILLMIPANLSPYFSEPHPMWYRVLGSYAAPVFIALSAGLVRMRSERHDARYYLERGALVVLTGMLLDLLLWEILPWTSYDVLYLIGIAMPVIYATRRYPPSEMFLIAVIIVVAAYVLQHLVGYNAEVYEVYLNELEIPALGRVLQSALVDGWFPLLPWMAFAFTGAGVFAATVVNGNEIGGVRIGAAGAAFIVVGVVLLVVPVGGIESFADGTILEFRAGYSEIFYPPTVGYVLTAVGAFLLFAFAARRNEGTRALALFSFFGRHSMMVYILHQVLGAKVLAPIIAASGAEMIEGGMVFTLANLGVIGVIALVCLGLDRIPESRVTRVLFVRLLLGR